MLKEVKTTAVQTDSLEELRLTYYVFDTSLELEGISSRRYGVRVETSRGEAETVADVSGSREAVLALIDRMCAGAVTPATVRDVISDWLCE